MPRANLLAKNQLGAFKAWLIANGHAWREGHGQYQVIQVQLAGETTWHSVYYRLRNSIHYSLPLPLIHVVEQFVQDKRGKRP